MKNSIKIIIGIIVLAGIFLYSSAYVVDETQQVIITQFGKVVDDPVTEPGLNFKIPFIQKTNYFSKILLEWDGDPGQVPTKDKKYIWVDTFARWKIVDPVTFFQTVTNEFSALQRLDDIIGPAMRNLVTSHPLVESVRNSDRPMDTFITVGDITVEEMEAQQSQPSRYDIELGRDEITELILKQAQPKVAGFGIDLVDVKVKRLNYIDKVRRAVYDRMIAERNQVAEKFRAQGFEKASEIRGKKEKKLQTIQSQAYETAQTIKGKADARAVKIYADAYSVDTDLYAFLKTLDVYTQSLDKESTVVLSTDSSLMRYFKAIDGR